MAETKASVETIWAWIQKFGEDSPNPPPEWQSAAQGLRALIDDHTQLKAAIDAIVLMEDPDTLTTAVDAATTAQTASEAAIS